MFINEPNFIRRQLSDRICFFADNPSGGGGAASDDPSGKSAGKKPDENGSIADVDFSDVPENIREAVKAKTASKVKHFQSDYTKKTEELSTLRKNLEKRESNLGDWEKIKTSVEEKPELANVLRKTWDDFESGKLSKPSKAVKEDLKLLDKLIDQTNDAGYKEDLRAMREIIKEETDVGSLKDEIKSLKDQLIRIDSTTRSVQADRIEKELSNLSNRFGKDVVDKYTTDIKVTAAKYPNTSVEKIFLQLADDSDIRTAFLNEAKQREKEEIERKKKGLEPSGEGVVKDIEIPRTKEGRVDTRKYIERIVNRHGLGKGL